MLGVRPNAGRTEIELAFKGRRAQYHPDRYTGEDGQTLQWATERMQEVNAAYAVLSDAEQRRRYDAGRTRQEPPSRKASGSAGPRHTEHAANGSPNDLPWREFLADSVVPQLTTDRVFCIPAIPQRKLQGALGSYGAGLDPQDVTLLIDDTFLGGGERGVLITDDEIRMKDLRGVWRMPFAEIYRIRGAGKFAVINESTRTVELDWVAQEELGCVLGALDDYLACKRFVPESANEPDLDDAMQQRVIESCRLHMAAPYFSGAKSCFVGQIPSVVLKLARFILGLPAKEQVLAVSNLDPRGHAQAFVVTSRGLHVKLAEERAFISWQRLRRLAPVEGFCKSIWNGVVFSDGTCISCSRLRADGQAYGVALMHALKSIQ